MTGFVSPQVVYMDGLPHYVRDLHPFPHMVNNSVEDESNASSDAEMYIPVTKD